MAPIIDDEDFAAFELRGAVLALFAADKLAADGRAPVEPRQGGIRFTLGIMVESREEVDQMAERVRQSGGRLTKQPVDAEFFEGRSAYFADPEDNYWEVAWAPGDNAIVAAARRACRRISILKLEEQGVSPCHRISMISSSLALHYVEAFDVVCGTIQRLLTPGGHLVFSVEHPIFTAPSNPGWQTDPTGATIWPLNSYLHEGPRVTEWITTGVVKQHRTIASYVNSLLAHGFLITHLDEWGPDAAQIAEHPEWANEVHRPPFFLVGARLQPREQR